MADNGAIVALSGEEVSPATLDLVASVPKWSAGDSLDRYAPL